MQRKTKLPDVSLKNFSLPTLTNPFSVFLFEFEKSWMTHDFCQFIDDSLLMVVLRENFAHPCMVWEVYKQRLLKYPIRRVGT